MCWSAADSAGFGSGWADKWDDTSRKAIQHLLSTSDLVVGANFKFDVSWLRKFGVDFSSVAVWDVLIAEFVISRQQHRLPSLADCCVKYGVPTKLDVVKTEYWLKGIDTDCVPWPILSEYAAHDAAITLAVYHAQLPYLTEAQRVLVRLMSQDSLVLQEMEMNGISLDVDMCAARSAELGQEYEGLVATLKEVYPSIPINFGSPQQLSCFLFGGVIEEHIKVPDGFYKTGVKKGLPKFRNGITEHHLPQLFTYSEKLADGIHYATNEPWLQKIKPLNPAHKEYIATILQLAKIKKMKGTYFDGLPKLIQEQNWPPGKIHGTFNQTIAGTGRLSSSKPNTQNLATSLQDIFVSDYPS